MPRILAMHPMPRTRATFRTDINGLRAWAVVAVVLYHFGVPGFGGGFVGVDVFFVILGLLMTGIVVKGLERGNFSLYNFYMARARRLMPALAGLCAVLLGAGWFVLFPPDCKTLGIHVLADVFQNGAR
jgi:peptidoglycan/LPS O-acetylase OafA/YrhL